MNENIQTDKRHALLVAGMHRSGTSALTRVLSLLGAELPGKLAPAIPQNNESGFWESVDLMVLHDELLESAGSSWSDWTAFNPDWYSSVEGDRYFRKILSVVHNDFSDSSLFAIKDPRICRFLPLWLNIAHELGAKPHIIIPVRNPLEVAHSLKNRDGFPLTKGGLIWLRHVLDAVHFSEKSSRALVDYKDLMLDWHKVVESIKAQLEMSFPRFSTGVELEIEAFLDQRQKHNNFTSQDIVDCREFHPLIASVYKLLLELCLRPDEPEIWQELNNIRLNFTNDSFIYSKALQSNERLLQVQKSDFEAELLTQRGIFKQKLSLQEADYEQKLSLQEADYEQKLSLQEADYEQRLSLQEAGYASHIARQAGSYETRLGFWEQENHRLKLQKSSYEKQISKLRQQIIESLESNECSESRRIASLFDVDWYLSQYPDISLSGGAEPLEHFFASGMGEGRHPHILFDVHRYLSRYPDVAAHEGGALSHYLQYGGKELREPHPLFNSSYYVKRYPDALSAGLTPLEHYLKYGAAWGCDPYPLFDSAFYQRQLREPISADKPFMVHYLENKHLWRVSPSRCFDADWYLEQYPDVVDAETNPLLHYALYGINDQRQPHPDAGDPGFQFKYNSLFSEIGVSLSSPKVEAVPLSVNENESGLVGDKRFKRMVDYQVTELQSDSHLFQEDGLVIDWVTCDFAREGGGGNATIFRFVRLFEQFGHQQRIWLHNKVTHDNADDAYEDLIRNYQQTSAQIAFIEDSPGDFAKAAGDIIIATDWESVWPVLSVQHFKRRFYFVQDHEPSFFAAGGHSLAAEMTYHEDLDCICAGPWLEKLMQERYGRWATKFWLAADQSVYFPAEQAKNNAVPRVAFYARGSTSRRAVELGLLALDFLAEKGVDFHVDVYGSDSNDEHLKFARFSYTDHGVLNSAQLGDLYRKCDVGMVFSATNYSLVPQEMMACGLVVLEMDGENTRSVYPEGGVVLAKPHPRQLGEQLENLLVNPEKRREIAHIGQRWASGFDWEATAREVSRSIQGRLESLGFQSIVPEDSSAFKVSVVIPSLNGGELLIRVLDSVVGQKAPWPFEILVIDSGSTDGTLSSMEARQDIRVHTIPKETFSHGGTRNLGVEMTSGEYIAFLTQDALPVDQYWLFNLVSLLEHDPDAAGAFGKHLAYPEASPFVHRDLALHFSALAEHPIYLSRETDRGKFESAEQGWRQLLHFYSDNNSCMRRSVWKQIPYPVIDYGEDQVWADQVIKAGFSKAYAINAVVYHSHDYDELETFERSQIEAAFFEKQFGYVMLVDEEEMLKRLEAINAADRVYAQEHGISQQMLERQLALNEAKLRGYLSAGV